MFKNYLKIAFRNLLRHKIYSLINISGLAIGMACCILILLFVRDELSYDRFHENSDRIYRLTRTTKMGDNTFAVVHTASAMVRLCSKIIRRWRRSFGFGVCDPMYCCALKNTNFMNTVSISPMGRYLMYSPFL